MIEQIQSSDKIEDIIFGAFNLKLPVSGGWGYSQDEATIISDQQKRKQIQYMFATARSTIEMNLTQTENERYGGINVKELSSETYDDFEKVTFEISAILEHVYAKFIQEYKDNHGKEGFDLKDHFSRREENTLKRIECFWFKKSNI